MNRKKLFVSNNLTIIKIQFHNFSNSIDLEIFEMHNLYMVWFYALRFVTCNFSLDAFSLLYSKLLLAKISLFVFGFSFAESHWQFTSI